ncbi:MAG: hypothetical protein LBM96_07000 [Methanobrevibacter sp.]|jgi:hypothetical protein|nr:hypothetical protein [Candidatus Methanoflexus mossambicus]
MTEFNRELVLGYDLEQWNNFAIKKEISVDISPRTNSHIILSGMSGSGKSYAELGLIVKLILAEPDGEYYFADYKADDNFECLRGTPRYRSFKKTTELLDIVYERLNDRMSGKDKTRNPITLIWDEYMANILALIGEDKKEATKVMNKVSEILLMGRSMAVRFICSCQRPDAIAFPVGSRLNYGIVIILGGVVKSIYEMLMPDYLEQIKGQEFNRGEGVVLLQGIELNFIKIGQMSDIERVKKICIEALSKSIKGGEA